MAMRIMVVDNSTVARMILKKTIEMTGIAVAGILEANNEQEAMALLDNNRVDVIIVDINMPKTTTAILANQVTRNIPIIVTSTQGCDQQLQRLLDQGIKHNIYKPFTPETVRNTLGKILEADAIALNNA
jgi:two-component system, chemotaxis family, chemotaxis protein CheY